MGLATRDQSAIAIGCGGVDKVQDRLDILEVNIQAHPIGEQASALQVWEYRELLIKVSQLHGVVLRMQHLIYPPFGTWNSSIYIRCEE